MSSFVKNDFVDNGAYTLIKFSGLGVDPINDIHILNTFHVNSKSYKILNIYSFFYLK